MKKKIISLKCIPSCRKTRVIILVAIMLISLMVAPGCSSSDEEGEAALDFSLADLDGKQVSLSELEGKVVFLNFWATTCPPCRAEMPHMETLYQNYKDQNVVIVSIDILESEDTVRQFVEQEDYSWTFVLDKTGAVANKYEIQYIPTSFFLDSEGIIRAFEEGSMSYETMEDNLAKAINKE